MLLIDLKRGKIVKTWGPPIYCPGAAFIGKNYLLVATECEFAIMDLSDLIQ